MLDKDSHHEPRQMMSQSRLQTLSEAIEEFAAQSAVEIHYEELRM